jgi:hypothetical protein
MLANLCERAACRATDAALAGIGQRWLEVERAMGIEYISLARPTSLNHGVASADDRCV